MDKIGFILRRTIFFLILYSIAFIPLFYYRKTLFPNIFSRAIIFQVLMEIAFGIYIILASTNKKYRPSLSNPFFISTFYLFL
ncbi:MAG: hypothetical protein HYW78_03505 [Parcubacteria group bacterium]|nr:hypothetical protein [Parcubacteria group bacterium]